MSKSKLMKLMSHILPIQWVLVASWISWIVSPFPLRHMEVLLSPFPRCREKRKPSMLLHGSFQLWERKKKLAWEFGTLTKCNPLSRKRNVREETSWALTLCQAPEWECIFTLDHSFRGLNLVWPLSLPLWASLPRPPTLQCPAKPHAGPFLSRACQALYLSVPSAGNALLLILVGLSAISPHFPILCHLRAVLPSKAAHLPSPAHLYHVP